MILSAADYLILAAYLAAVVWTGLRAAGRREAGSEDYILVGRTLTLPSFVATLVPSFYGGTLGVGEYTYRYGISNWLAQGAPYYLFSLLYAALVAGRIRESQGLTIPDHLERAYGRKTAALAAFLVFLLASPADEALMLGTLAQWVTGWPLWLCLLMALVAAAGFLFAGGLRADVWANRLEFLVMFGGFSLILPFAVLRAGGTGFLAANLPPSHLDWTGGKPPLFLMTWFFLALWTFVDPAFHQRVCAAKDAATARRGICVSVLFWAAFDFLTTTTGLYARAMLPDLQEPLQAYPALASHLLPSGIRGLFLAGVASSPLAALGSTSFLSAVSLGRDAAGRIWTMRAEDEEAWVRRGLLATCALSFVLALALPSVVALWYAVGSVVIPGLLIPLTVSYFPALRPGPRGALACSLAGCLASSAAWALGDSTPFYPGLAASAVVYLLALMRR
mgnify:FL=1